MNFALCKDMRLQYYSKNSDLWVESDSNFNDNTS